jgi:hypothetical protein
MDLKVIHDNILFELNKSIEGYITPSEIDEMLDRAQMEEFRYLIGDERSVQAGRAVATPSYGQLMKTNADLEPFKKAFQFTSRDYTPSVSNGTGPGGIIVLPADFLYPNSIVLTSQHRRIKIVNENELAFILDSPVLAPTIQRPIAVLGNVGGIVNNYPVQNKKIQLFPNFGNSGIVYYFSRPVKPNYVETINGRVRTYNQAESTQMEWNDVAINRVIERALKIAATHLKDAATLQINAQKNVS